MFTSSVSDKFVTKSDAPTARGTRYIRVGVGVFLFTGRYKNTNRL